METPHNRIYGKVPLGISIRKSIAKLFTFRVRRGNGEYGAKKGALYQDQYRYFVPSSINNNQSANVRDHFKTAVSNWRHVLTPLEKQAYNARANAHGAMSGYNLYISEYIKGAL